ncbi:MAG: hypothetical protein JHC95_18860, partial [Solirubrobacteraceae bacterium]|nr:hypothetical protein [Solirubrobacteraceae bacterium]
MTDAAPKRRPVRPIAPQWVWSSAAGAFCVALAALALQVRAGGDPALGAGTPAPAAQVASAPPQVVIRRIEQRRVVTHVVPAPEPQAVAAAPAPEASTPTPAVSAPAPVVSAPAPVVSAPAPAPSPAPAPAPPV